MRSRLQINRQLFAGILGLWLATSLLTTAALAQQSSIPLVQAVESVGMTVADMDRTIEFYSKVLSFEKVSDVEVSGEAYEHLQGLFGLRMRVVRMRLGDEFIELTEYLVPRGRPIPVDTRSNDRWFQHMAIIVSRGRLFLGIDHTAIVVGDTEASLRFYRDVLGLRVVGESENYGTEQEHLNNVFGARLRITTLRATAGPGIELLEYLAPRDGRPTPADARANDLMHWQTQLVTGDATLATQHLRGGRAGFVSPGLVALPDSSLGFRKGFLVRDPDGRVIRVIQP